MALEPITRQEQIIAGKDLEPITRMEKFLKKYGGSGGAGGGVSPEEVTTIVKERFPGGVGYDEVQTIEILPKTHFEFVNQNGQLIAQAHMIGIEDLETYKVSWNGECYECVAFSFTASVGSNTFTSLVVGNSIAVGGEDTGEPFAIAVNIAHGVASVASFDGSTEADVSIEQTKVVTKKLDAKYLPNTGGMYYVNPENFVWADVLAAYKSGALLYALNGFSVMYPCRVEDGDVDDSYIEFSNIVPSWGQVYGLKIWANGMFEYQTYDVELSTGK